MSILLTTAEEAWAATHEGEELPIVHRARDVMLIIDHHHTHTMTMIQ